jgi:hypothetical protein
LLAHEITHSVQYRQLGSAAFIGRYVKESAMYGESAYGVPATLGQEMMQGRMIGSVVSKSYTLDQMADTVGREATWRLRGQ